MSTCYDCQYWDSKTDLCKKTKLKKFQNSAICAEFLHIPACIVCRHFSGRRCALGIVDFDAAKTIAGVEGEALDPETCICRTGDFTPRTSRRT